MKLLKQTRNGWQYFLEPNEANCLEGLLKQFPITKSVPAKITKSTADPKAAEREKLLNESLAEHRTELNQKAWRLIGNGKLKVCGDQWRLNINVEEREILLQILNDIRVGSWRALGEPESFEPGPEASDSELFYLNLLNLAGYFEFKLLNLEEADRASPEH
ncbi:MAG TPA: hypothetical protein VKA67_11640 [Verrucomicrobiae bacterium]|nr:hypothetical protein [Verrucomicrobiae bacterium]